MINWFKNKKPETCNPSLTIDSTIEPAAKDKPADEQAYPSLFSRLRQSLNKTREYLSVSIGRLLIGKKIIDAKLLTQLEEVLLRADLGINTTQLLLKELNNGLNRKQLLDGDAVFAALKSSLVNILNLESASLTSSMPHDALFIILVVGVNGAGKTTTIGKLANQYKSLGKKVMLAAGDTFRAGAIEQLQSWGLRNHVTVIAQDTGADSASVIFDACSAARARGIDVLLVDTAGRLHTQFNLMEELKKIKRVIKKLDQYAPHETMLVLDASIGQNALAQARQFHEAIGITGISMTKLDGSAKGGILFAIANELKIPFRYIGVGEELGDLRPFDAVEFVDAIFDNDCI